MEFFKKYLHFSSHLQISSAALLLILLTIIYKLISIERNKKGLKKQYSSSSCTTSVTKTPVPQASGAWPVIGHLRLITNAKESTHITLAKMADKYGPIFSIRFGSHKTLIVSSWEMVKECFTGTNDKLLSNRPPHSAFEHMFYQNGYGVGLVPYGEYWRELRKITTHNLLANQTFLKYKHFVTSEVDTSFRKLYELCNNNKKHNSDRKGATTPAIALIRMDDWLTHLTHDVVGRIVGIGGSESNAATGTMSSRERFILAHHEASHFVTTSSISDIVPWLGWIDRLTGLTRKMKNCGKKLDMTLGSIIEERRQKRQFCRTKGKEYNSTNIAVEDKQEDFIDICFSLMEQSQLPGENPEISIKSFILDIMSAGTDTTKSVLIWTISLLLNHPHVLSKAKQEVDAHFGMKRRSTDDIVVVDVDDVHNLVYIHAIFKESMRLYPVSPVMERMTSDDCVVGGFCVPAGTRVWVNVWKMQRDPTVWEDPTVFQPERFLSDNKRNIDIAKGHNYELIPFGTGRRKCPGSSFALELMHLVLTRLILEFEMKAPGGKVDMTETSSVILSAKVAPVDVLISPRTP
ncbi:hypothetical protein C5167_018371 [Papaver somniferum]|uniref:Cytochrome P450 n=1 Tax=Papaver somniferum TaxID=3469 RepID=A0A4Y7IR61_PAPSO|nr:bifunctional protein STORR-like [Papaver somniferum]RZC49945.1 hypothetical protein C5167_018371 [Papaver somniferum]